MTDISVDLKAGTINCGPITTICIGGRGGMKPALAKCEGDDATPLGSYPLRFIYYRADRLEKPHTALPSQQMEPNDGWCDDINHPLYNQPIKHPFKASAEHLWRTDHIYDVILVIGHNDAPPIANRGSAIFVHCARPGGDARGLSFTRGCVALPCASLLDCLRHVDPNSYIHITA